MNTLHLNLKKKWFDMILSREKKEEYRDLTPYWRVRLKNARRNNIKTVTFSNGYAKDRRQMTVNISYTSIRTGLFSWGAELGKIYYIIHLGDIISIRNIKEKGK